MNQLKLQKFSVDQASHADFAAIAALRNKMRHEIDPDDPARSVEHTSTSLKNIPSIAELHLWLAKKDNDLVGLSNIVIVNMEDNQHLAEASIQVLKEHRKQGIAKQLLTPIVETARAENRRILVSNTNSRVAAGEAFMKRLNAKAGLVGHVNQLLLTELDAELMQKWQSSDERKEAFELVFWEDEVPEDQLEAYCRMKDLINTQPLDDLDLEDINLTPDIVRQLEARHKARGQKHAMLIAKHKSTGELAGYTETLWSPDDKQTLQQEDTAVMPSYRGNGLGKWLKATMLNRMQKQLPDITRVRTGNADSNDAMLSINTAMGFKPFQAITLWQVERTDIEAYLA